MVRFWPNSASYIATTVTTNGDWTYSPHAKTVAQDSQSTETYAEYVEQIAKLQSLAEAARKDEINGAIQKNKELMQLHGVSIDDLSSARGSKPAKAKSTVAAKFKNPETGETWTGRGRAPRWLVGKDKEQFRITGLGAGRRGPVRALG